jgi:hypothetical protein
MKKRIISLTLLCAIASPVLGAQTLEERKADKRGEIAGPVQQDLYTKPVWRKMGHGTYVGGYADFEYRNRQDAKQKFDAVRVVPFIYADIAPGLRFATEIEFEHGGVKDEGDVTVSTTTGSGTASLSGESKVEFAVLDYDLIGESLGFRGGIVLIPVGKFNLAHDSPINDLNDRPLVSRTIIPTTFAESGAGLFGTLYPMDPLKLDYQFYVTQGYNGGATGSKITKASGLRDARSSIQSDNNENLGYSGRVALSPFLGSEIGASFYSSVYDDAGQNALTTFAGDWGFQWRFLEFLGEYANTQIGKDSSILASVPERMEGYYAQLNIHFLQDAVRPGSTFTGVTRWDSVNTDLRDDTNDRQRLTFGLNFRPVEQTVFKLDYQVNYEDMAVNRTLNNAWILGFATYF